MSVWFSQKVSAIGKSEDLVKMLNIGVKPGDLTTYAMGPIHFSAGAKNRPPFPLTAMSKRYPNVVFAVSTMVECESYYRFLLLNGRHTDVVTMSPIVSIDELNKIEGHYKWTEGLKYDEAVEMIGIKPPEATVIPINEDTEIEFIEEVVEYEAT